MTEKEKSDCVRYLRRNGEFFKFEKEREKNDEYTKGYCEAAVKFCDSLIDRLEATDARATA